LKFDFAKEFVWNVDNQLFPLMENGMIFKLRCHHYVFAVNDKSIDEPVAQKPKKDRKVLSGSKDSKTKGTKADLCENLLI
jgi:hypothetical protein